MSTFRLIAWTKNPNAVREEARSTLPQNMTSRRPRWCTRSSGRRRRSPVLSLCTSGECRTLGQALRPLLLPCHPLMETLGPAATRTVATVSGQVRGPGCKGSPVVVVFRTSRRRASGRCTERPPWSRPVKVSAKGKRNCGPIHGWRQPSCHSLAGRNRNRGDRRRVSWSDRLLEGDGEQCPAAGSL